MLMNIQIGSWGSVHYREKGRNPMRKNITVLVVMLCLTACCSPKGSRKPPLQTPRS